MIEIYKPTKKRPGKKISGEDLQARIAAALNAAKALRECIEARPAALFSRNR